MKNSVILACGFVAAFTVVGIAGDQADVKKELARFQGTWTPVSAESNGKEAPKEALAAISITFDKDTLTVKRGEETVLSGTFKPDPTKTPNQYEATSAGRGKKLNSIGIYEIKGDTLKVCYTPKGGMRPKEFSTKGGTEEQPISLTVYKRQAKKDGK
jgi:uncharacterized protein (TIGR03067 family)